MAHSKTVPKFLAARSRAVDQFLINKYLDVFISIGN